MVFGKIREKFDDITDSLDVIEIVPFISYRHSNGEKMRLYGRVQEDRSKHPVIKNIDENFLSAFEEVVGVERAKELVFEINPDPKDDIQVELTVDSLTTTTTTDKDGFYDIEIDVPKDIPFKRTNGTVSIQQNSSFPLKKSSKISNTFDVIMPNPKEVRFGVISDIDDTILQSDVTNPLKLLYNTILVSTENREATPGTPKFYNEIHDNLNPFFYISNSPLFLYQSVKQFIEDKKFPTGPILLRNLDIKELRNSMHKKETIARVLDSYTELEFILIGDSSEQDLQIYSVSISLF